MKHCVDAVERPAHGDRVAHVATHELHSLGEVVRT
jgi:hypothetical protein